MMWVEAKIRGTQLGFAKVVYLLLPVPFFQDIFINCTARPKHPVHVEQQNPTGVAVCSCLKSKQLFIYCETIPFTSETINSQQASRFYQALFPYIHSCVCYAHWTLYIRQLKSISISELPSLESCSCVCGRRELWLQSLLYSALERSDFLPSRLGRFTPRRELPASIEHEVGDFPLPVGCFGEETISCPCRQSKHESFVFRLLARIRNQH